MHRRGSNPGSDTYSFNALGKPLKVSELHFLIYKMGVNIFIGWLCGSKEMLSTMPGTQQVSTMLTTSTYKGKRGKPYKMMARWNVRKSTAETSGLTLPCPGEATALRPRTHHKAAPEAVPLGSCSSAPSLIPPCLSSLNALKGRPHKGWYQNILNAEGQLHIALGGLPPKLPFLSPS